MRPSTRRAPEVTRRAGAGRAIALALFVAAALLGAPSVARAEGDALARQLYSDGQTAFETGRFDQAIELFERAYAASHRPQLLWNIAKSHRRQFEVDHDLTHLRRARLVYQSFSELIGNPKEAAQGLAEKKQVEAELTRLEAAAPRPVESAPATATSATATGATPGAAKSPVPASGATESSASPPTENRAATDTTRSDGRPSLAPAVALVVAGAALAGAGLAFNLLSLDASNRVQSAGSPGAPVPFSRYAGDESQGHAFDALMGVGYALGAVAVAAGVVVAVVRAGQRQASARRDAGLSFARAGAF